MRRIGISPTTYQQSPSDRMNGHMEVISAAATARIDAIGLYTMLPGTGAHTAIVTDRRARATAKRSLARNGIDVIYTEGVLLHPETVPADLEPVVEATAELGSTELMCSVSDPDEVRLIANLHELDRICSEYRCHINIEFLPFYAVSSLAKTLQIVGAAACPTMGIMIDILHLVRSGGSVADVALVDQRLIHFVHLCDAAGAMPVTEVDVKAEWVDRRFPGDGDLPLFAFLDAIPESAPLMVEAPRGSDAGKPPRERAMLVADTTRRLLSAYQMSRGKRS